MAARGYAASPDGPRGDAPASLAERRPSVSADRLIAELLPPPRFASARFSTYLPDPGEPSQSAARDLLAERAATWSGKGPARARRGLLRRGSGPAEGRGVYLDGGYGVGKTHLLASLWHETEGPKVYGTFVEYTNLVGALGFGPTVAHLATQRLVCIDEFELDDPGDTVLVSTLLTRLAEAGVQLAATSNTLPDQLGEGRFAAADFLREIQGLSARFTAVRIEGPDYRRRDGASAPEPLEDEVVAKYAADGPDRFLDDFEPLTAHLSTLHPSRYGALLDGVGSLGLLGLKPVEDQNAALRLVVFVDRLYDRSVPVLASGVAADRVFTPELLAGGYRKKYLRAVSRLISLTQAGAALA
ncbi:cell division protein ZapE [Actinospica robiniae]|uniref:cell division protein ZapE n=1 Tax=Actinospica robiniae TaxID=304901 RepID=UPI000684AC1D